MLYLCDTLLTTRQGTCLFSWQAFLCLLRYSIRRFRTPVWSVNAPTAWLVKSNGKGGTALIILDFHQFDLTD